jgi:hypothetical protein
MAYSHILVGANPAQLVVRRAALTILPQCPATPFFFV